MPAIIDASSSSAEMSTPKEQRNTAKVLDELMAKLSISKAQDDINAATHNIAVFINSVEEDSAAAK